MWHINRAIDTLYHVHYEIYSLDHLISCADSWLTSTKIIPQSIICPNNYSRTKSTHVSLLVCEITNNSERSSGCIVLQRTPTNKSTVFSGSDLVLSVWTVPLGPPETDNKPRLGVISCLWRPLCENLWTSSVFYCASIASDLYKLNNCERVRPS